MHDDVPALRYLIRIPIVEFQDWHTPPTSSDDEFYGAGDDSDSGDSNFNGCHPGVGGGGGGSRPRMTRFARPDEPRLGRGVGLAFWARETRLAVRVGAFAFPFVSTRGAVPCSGADSGVCGLPATRGEPGMEEVVDFGGLCLGSPSSVKFAAGDPMVDEAALCTPRQGVRASCHEDSGAQHSIDFWPHCGHSSCSLRRGMVGSALEADGDLLHSYSLHGPSFNYGPDALFGCSPDSGLAARTLSLEELVMDLSLSGSEDPASGLSSPGPGLFGWDTGYSTDDGPAEAVVSIGGASSQAPAAATPPSSTTSGRGCPRRRSNSVDCAGGGFHLLQEAAGAAADHDHTEATPHEKQGAQGAH